MTEPGRPEETPAPQAAENAEVVRLQKELREKEEALEAERAKVATLITGMYKVVATTTSVYYVDAAGPEEAEKWYYANAHLTTPTEKKVEVVVDGSADR